MEKQLVNSKISCQKTGCQKLTRKTAIRTACPACGYRNFYKLFDGRRQCIRCRKKFTPGSRKPRLPKETIKEIARLFWLMVPAARVAKDIRVNPKTVLKYYHLMREVIAQEREQELAQLTGEIEVDESYFGGVRKGKRGRGAAGKVPVFGLLKRNGEVRVVFLKRVDKKTLQGAIKEHVKPQSWVYSDSYRAYDTLHLEGFHHVRISHSNSFANGKTHINGIENFWGFAKRRLKMYHGGYKKNLPLFIREMEFRFNYRNDHNVIDYLFKLVALGPN